VTPALASEPSPPCVTLRGISYAWPRQAEVLAIDALDIATGDRVFIQGASGSGKSTLLGLIGGVLEPARGQIRVLGTELTTLRAAVRDRFRAEQIGFVFQQFNLLPYLNVLDNVTLPLNFARQRRARALAGGESLESAATKLLASLDLSEPGLLKRDVNALSVGQQQRVAVARALIGAPALIIADEPTSALDTDSRERFMQLLFDACAKSHATLLFVSHDRSLKAKFDRVIVLDDINQATR
jgi:putative ABC transport system ATP-binding protein